MSSQPAIPTSGELIAVASGALTTGGYSPVYGLAPEWDGPSARLFENEFSIVGVVAYPTATDLLRDWTDRQGSLASVITRYIGKSEMKAWDGCLVLLTPGPAGSDSIALEEVRYNTLRLRKLVASGEQITESGDVARVLLPLLPLVLNQVAAGGAGALEQLPSTLLERGVPERVTVRLVEAFAAKLSLMDAIRDGVNS